jgi:two-component system, chemotaxis family, sensor kinase CheA
MRTSLRAKLVRSMVATLVAVSSGTLLAVVALDVFGARQTLRTLETQIRASIDLKGRNLVSNQALALRDLVADNAFGDVARMVERTVERDDQLVYGVFLDEQRKVWAFAAPRAGAATAAWRQQAVRSTIPAGTTPAAAIWYVGSQRAFEYAARVVDDKGTRLGTLRYALSDGPLQSALAEARAGSQRTLAITVGLLVLLAAAAMTVGVLRSRHSAARITRPLGELTRAVNTLAGGRRDIRVDIPSGDELEILGTSFNAMAAELADSYARLEQMNRTLEAKVEERTHELARRNQDMRLVLDNVTQGFLTLTRSGELALERSAVVDRWFGAYPPGTRYTDHLRAVDAAYAASFAIGYDALMDEVLPRELCLEQLPTRIRQDQREYRCAYVPLVKGDVLDGVLVVVSDVTSELLLARREAERRELLAVFESLARDRTGFLAFFDEADELQSRVGVVPQDEQRRILHTLKGNAGLVGLDLVAGLCTELEDLLDERTQPLPPSALLGLQRRWDELGAALSRFLGDKGRDVLELGRGEIEALEERVRAGLPATALLDRLAAWKLEPVERPLQRLGRHATALAARLGKGALQVDVRDHGIRLDPKTWAALWADLVHVVRNAVDHGLESPAERQRAGKTAPSHLRLTVRIANARLWVEVEDDGRGVDWGAVRATADDLGLPHATPAELTAALFDARLSTRTTVTAVSGRGVGLAAVRCTVEAMRGEISVSSRPGRGTRIALAFPLPVSLSQLDVESSARRMAEVSP